MYLPILQGKRLQSEQSLAFFVVSDKVVSGTVKLVRRDLENGLWPPRKYIVQVSFSSKTLSRVCASSFSFTYR